MTIDQRVSLFQTSLNNAVGKSPKTLVAHAKDIYALSLVQIRDIGNSEIAGIEEVISIPKKRMTTKKAEKLIAKLSKKRFNRKIKK
jgi:hypothetical protein